MLYELVHLKNIYLWSLFVLFLTTTENYKDFWKSSHQKIQVKATVELPVYFMLPKALMTLRWVQEKNNGNNFLKLL